MRRNNAWKFALVVFVVAWSLYEMYPPTPRDLLVEFQGRAVRKDATFTSIMERVAQLQKEKPNRTFGNLKEAVGTNDDAVWWTYCIRRLGTGAVDRALGQLKEATRASAVRNRGGLLTKIFKDIAKESGEALQ